MRNLSLRAERPEFMRLTMRSRLDFEIERRSGTLSLVRCPFLPVAVTTNVPIAGTSIAATSMSAPLRAASVSPMPLKAGNGTAASIPAPTPASSAGGTAFEQAREHFERVWMVFSSRRCEADYQARRDQQRWTKEKYARFDRGERTGS